MVTFRGNTTWLGRRTRIERILLSILTLMVIVLILLIVVIVVYGKGTANVCQTAGCIEASANILKLMDKTVDPCDNFYDYVCGNFPKENPIPKDTWKVDQFSAAIEQVDEQIKNMLEEMPQDDENRSSRIVKNYFKACMDEELIEKQSNTPLKNLLKDLGGWPVLEENTWNEEAFNWIELLYEIRRNGLNIDVLFEVSVHPDPTNSKVRIVELDQPANFGLTMQYLRKRFNTNHYKDLMVNIAVELGANRSFAEEELEKSLDFEITLANMSLLPEERRNISELVTHMTVKKMQQKYPRTPWLTAINNLLLNLPLNDNKMVLVVAPTFFESFDKLMAETPKRVVANYVLWRVVLDTTLFGSKEIYRHQLIALEKLDGIAQRSPRLKECIQTVKQHLPLLTSALYVRRYFDEETKQNAEEITDYLKKEFRQILQELSWMDGKTKQRNIQKLEKMGQLVGYPKELKNETLLENYVKKLEVFPDQYLKSYLNIRKHSIDYKFSRLKLPVTPDWIDHAGSSDVGALYNSLENIIIIYAGILQGIFFDKNRPKYMNFGAIGAVIGHEITHGFDDVGWQFDENRVLADWWEPQSKANFIKKTECIIEQYGNYTLKIINEKINGKLTQGENIADNGGLKEAYFAYQSWVADHSSEPILPGFEGLTPNQLFWISSAVKWCANGNPQHWKADLAQNSHSPGEIRVLGPLSNSEEFAKDFACPEGSRMNPAKKCNVW